MVFRLRFVCIILHVYCTFLSGPESRARLATDDRSSSSRSEGRPGTGTVREMGMGTVVHAQEKDRESDFAYHRQE